MSFWEIIIEAMNDVKFGFIIAMFAGYGMFRLSRGSKSVGCSCDDTSIASDNDSSIYDNIGSDGEDTKMVLIIRNDLKMGKGKVAAQCAHGAVAAYKTALKHPKLLRAWETEGQKKITLKVESDATLKELAKQARAVGLITNIVQDAGRTQIAAGSRTVCAIGPGPSSVIDEITGHLKLF